MVTGETGWVDYVKPDPEAHGIPVKDVFNDDGRKIAFLTYGKDDIVVLMHDLGSKYTTSFCILITHQLYYE